MVQPIDDPNVVSAETVIAALDGATIPTATVAANDKVIIQDTDDNDELKTVTAQSIADLGGGGSFSGAAFGGTADQTIATATWTTFNPSAVAEEYDTDGYHDNSTNKERFTIPAGVAFIELSFRGTWGVQTAGDRFMRLVHYNSSDVLQAYVGYESLTPHPATGESRTFTASRPVAVSAGDYLIAQVYQSSGGNLIFYARHSGEAVNPEQFGWFSIKKLG